MRCYYHSHVETVSGCSVCRKFLCESCSHSIKGKVYCQDCLVAGADLAALATAPQLANYSPARAALFAIIPGIGAVYNRQYLKAVLHFSVFMGLILLAERGLEVLGLAVFAWYVYMIIDAYRSAQVIMRQAVLKTDLWESSTEIRLPIWGGAMVLLGVLFFLDNLGVFSIARMGEFLWPLLFVAFGVYLIVDYYLHRRPKLAQAVAPPPLPTPPNGTAVPESREEN